MPIRVDDGPEASFRVIFEIFMEAVYYYEGPIQIVD